MLSIVILNNVPLGHSKLAGEVTRSWLLRCATALETQLRQHVSSYWPNAIGAEVHVGDCPSELRPTDSPCNVIASADGDAEAWHDDEANGNPDEFLVLDECKTLDDVSGGISHEDCEIAGNPECDGWVTAPSGLILPAGISPGMQIAHELCDPIQDRFYPIDLGDGLPAILAADFVLPAYFDLSIGGPTTYGEAAFGLPRVDPFGRTSGGYQIARNADGSGETQVFGSITKHALAKLKKRRSRLRKIGLKSGLEVTA